MAPVANQVVRTSDFFLRPALRGGGGALPKCLVGAPPILWGRRVNFGPVPRLNHVLQTKQYRMGVTNANALVRGTIWRKSFGHSNCQQRSDLDLLFTLVRWCSKIIGP
jgi:hypothetical protein